MSHTKVFRVHYVYTESDWIVVNADNADEAEQAALEEVFADSVEIVDVYEV